MEQTKHRRSPEKYNLWYAANRERILAATRKRRAINTIALNASRRERYAMNSLSILAAQRANRVVCEHCSRDYRKTYLADHIIRKHHDVIL